MENIRLNIKKYTSFLIKSILFLALIYEPLKPDLKEDYFDNEIIKFFLNYIINNIPVGIYLLLIKFHYSNFWKCKKRWFQYVLRFIGFDTIPDISGIWEGHFITNYKGKNKNSINNTAEFKIQQTYNTLNIEMIFNKSTSNNINYLLNKRDDGYWHLSYEYKNITRDENLTYETKSGDHIGFCSCQIRENEMYCWYANKRNRGTAGEIILKKKTLKLPIFYREF